MPGGITVSGFTMTKAAGDFCHSFESQTQKVRSTVRRRGRLQVRWYAASCWRSARFSSMSASRRMKRLRRKPKCRVIGTFYSSRKPQRFQPGRGFRGQRRKVASREYRKGGCNTMIRVWTRLITLMSFPTLFAYERVVQSDARIGFIRATQSISFRKESPTKADRLLPSGESRA